MKKIILFGLGIAFSAKLTAYRSAHNYLTSENQIQHDTSATSPPLRYAEKMPEYPGGEEAMREFIAKKIKYPKEAIKNEITGKVYVEFIVEKDGSLSNIVVKKGIGHGCDEAAAQVISKMKKWIPGSQNGKPVRVFVILPIKFSLEDLKENKKPATK